MHSVNIHKHSQLCFKLCSINHIKHSESFPFSQKSEKQHFQSFSCILFGFQLSRRDASTWAGPSLGLDPFEGSKENIMSITTTKSYLKTPISHRMYKHQFLPGPNSALRLQDLSQVYCLIQSSPRRGDEKYEVCIEN